MFNQIFLSPQVKRWTIIPYKHSIYELTHELPGGCFAHTSKKKIYVPRKLRNIKKVSKPHKTIAQWPVPPPKCGIKEFQASFRTFFRKIKKIQP